MKYIEEYLETVIKIKPLGELTTQEDTLDGMSGEMVYIDGKCSGIFISHADYANWLENRTNKHPEASVSMGYLQNWYQDSIDETEEPIWTDKHLEELFEDFYLVPKRV